MGHYVVLLVVMSLLVTSLAMPALAQGQVERGPARTRSICSYSGLNDDPDDPVEGAGRSPTDRRSRRVTSSRARSSRARRAQAFLQTEQPFVEGAAGRRDQPTRRGELCGLWPSCLSSSSERVEG